MRTETTTRTLYKFNELPEDVKDKVVEKLYDINVDSSFWYESTLEDAKNIGVNIKGFDCGYSVKAEFISSAPETAENIMKKHGEKCETYSTAKKLSQ